ncbi:MAG: diguanylate cyclase [Chloroflexi bacterium]|nr:diguanylate cyclase [Chloroflexota bacterium]
MTRKHSTQSFRVRSVDSFDRYGGDEFVILLTQSNTQAVLVLAERIRASVTSIHIITPGRGLPLLCLEMTSQRFGMAVLMTALKGWFSGLKRHCSICPNQAGRNRTVILHPEERGIKLNKNDNL